MDPAKRLFDIAIGTILAVVTLPVVAVGAIASAIRFRANPFFTQQRLGRGGTPFTFVKLRSLPVTVPTDADKYQLGAMPHDRWSTQMRAHHVDELPQLWLVVAGSMSLVGPRPEMPRLAATFDQGFVAERATIRPGCTGLWQISSAASGLIGESPQFDLHYVRHRTMRLDLWILWRTLAAVIDPRRLVSLDDIPQWTGARPGRPAAACGD